MFVNIFLISKWLKNRRLNVYTILINFANDLKKFTN